MAKRYRDDVEDIAQKISDLKWKDMMSIGTHLASIEIDGTESPDDWCRFLYDWAEAINDTYKQETEGS